MLYALFYFLCRALTCLIECVGTDEIVRCSVHNHMTICLVSYQHHPLYQIMVSTCHLFLFQPLVRPLIPKVVAFINQILTIDEVSDCSLFVVICISY